MKRHLQILSFAILGLITSIAFGQKAKIKEAEKEYANLAYIKTTEILLEVVNNGYESEEAYRKLGNSFYFNRKMKEASTWYGKLMGLNPEQDPEYYFRYAQALKGIGNYAESDKWMLKFSENKKSDLRARSFASSKDYLSMIDSVSRDLELKNLELNSSYSDFGTTLGNNQIIFASARGGGEIHTWSDEPFLDLYMATKNENGDYDKASPLNDKINTKYHESTVAFMPDRKTMYFTRNNYLSKKFKKNSEGVSLLKIFKATLNDKGEWDKIESIHFNSDDYSVAHPTINSAGTKMYFASDMKGTLGASDIFVVDINKDGTLGEPVNLGPQINTEASETFPFVNSKGDLYYSSNGFNGLGGLDVFVVRDFENKKILNKEFVLENLGKPINSSSDDFGYAENLKTKEAFFTSNREGGKGSDDIYSFKVPECKQQVKGLVKDKQTLELLPGALVTLFDEFGNKLAEQTVGDNGLYVFNDLGCNRDYIVRGEKKDYLTDEKRFSTNVKGKDITIEDLLLEKDVQEIEPCDDLAKKLDIPIIYFDFDKWKIRYDAEVQLQKVLAVLNKFPTMTIAIKSHTDCRGTAKYNETLSENRAQATRKYLISKGIDGSRIVAKGYGESKLLNDCACEPTNKSNCTEEAHQLNRRSEFIITSINGIKCDEAKSETK